MDITSVVLIGTITLSFVLFILRIILIIRRFYLLDQQLKITSNQRRAKRKPTIITPSWHKDHDPIILFLHQTLDLYAPIYCQDEDHYAQNRKATSTTATAERINRTTPTEFKS
uniref:Uncharacterized protein n=1 Tax=Glossina brevipalpis TaxID=37001 RepID=A0A1A9W9R3_9MUSC